MMEKRYIHISLKLKKDLSEILDNWRSENHIWSRSEAIRILLAKALKNENQKEEAS